MKKRLLGLFSIIFMAILLVSCGGGNDKTFKVEFDLDGGLSEVSIEAQNVKEGGLVTKPADPFKDGHTFLNWTLDGQEWLFESDKVAKDMTLKAAWSAIEYKVSFDTKGGAPVPADQMVNHGSKAVEPETPPALEGNNFLGWYLDGVEYDFDSNVTKALNLEAVWGVKVSFDLDGGTPAVSPQTMRKGEKASEPAVPTKENATFIGWFLDGEQYDFNSPVEVSIELQARWAMDYAAVLANLEAHYASTLGNQNWHPTSDVELLAEINGLPITWTSSNPNYFTNAGVVTIPTHSEGNKTIMLTAALTPVDSVVFFFIIEALKQTTEELLDDILRIVTIVPTYPSGYQEENFTAVSTYKIGEDDVAITWTTSDDSAMLANGQLVGFEDAAEKEVTLTATITYNGVTRTRELHLLVKGVTTYSGLLEGLQSSEAGEKIKVEGVFFFMPIKDGTNTPGGYYIADMHNEIAYVHANPPAELKPGKIYDVLFEVDIFYGTYQVKSPAFVEERDGEIPEITPIETSLDEIVVMTKPEVETYNQQYLLLKDLLVYVHDANDNYGTFLVNQDFEPGVTVLNDQNSLMIYYVSNMDVIKALDGKRIDEILVINNGYRTNNIVWYVNYVGDGSDIVMGALTDEEAVLAAQENLEKAIPYKVINEDGILLETELFGATIVWDSSDELVIDPLTGEVTIGSTEKVVTLTATITAGEEEVVFTREIWVGSPEDLEVSEMLDVIEYDGMYGLMPFKVTGVVTGAIGDRSFTLYDGVNAVAIRTLANVALDYGYEYTVVGYKAVFNGLIQIAQSIEVVKGGALPLEEPTVLTEANLKDNAFLGELQSHLVSFENAEITKKDVDRYGTIDITLKVGTAQIVIRWDNRVPITQTAKDLLNDLVVGDIVNIVGAPVGWYKGPQLGYNSETQIVVKGPETDEEVVAAAIAALNVPQKTTVSLTLPTEGRFEAEITWTSSHPEVIANDGTLVMPEENTEVTLTAEVKFGDFTDVVDFVVLVQADENVLNVKLARQVPKDSQVKFMGVVSGMDPERYVYVSDEDGTTIVLYTPNRPEGLAVGDKVVVQGERDTYNGLEQIKFGASIEILESGLDIPNVIEVEKIPAFSADDQGKRYNIENLIVVSVNGRTLIVTDGIKEVTVYVDPANESLNAHILTAVGKKVNLVGVHLGWFNNGQFLIYKAAQVVVEELSNEDKVYVDLMSIVLPNSISTEDPLALITEGSKHESVISWSSSDINIIDVDGTVVLPEEETEVTLTATATLGEAELTITFKITVKAAGGPVEALATLKYPGGTTTNMSAGNNAETVGLDSNIFNVTSIERENNPLHIGLNTTGQIRLYGSEGRNGNVLKVETSAGNEIVKIEIKFGGTVGDASIKVDDVEEFNGALTANSTVTYSNLTALSFSIKNINNSKDQIYILEIIITYLASEGETEPVEPEPDPEPEEVTSLADFVLLEVNDTATVRGIITNLGGFNSFSMEDETGAVAFRIVGKTGANIDFQVGDEIEAEVKKELFKGLIQATLVGDYDVVSSNNALPNLLDLNSEDLDAANLTKYQSRIIELDNMEITDVDIDEFGTITFTLKRSDEATIILRWDNRVIFTGQEYLLDFEVGNIVNLRGVTIGWYNAPQFAIDGVGQVILVD